jgi:hypothetical protein
VTISGTFSDASVLRNSTSRLKALWLHAVKLLVLKPTTPRCVSPLSRGLHIAAVGVTTTAGYQCCSRLEDAKVAAARLVQAKCRFLAHLTAREIALPMLCPQHECLKRRRPRTMCSLDRCCCNASVSP